MKLPKWSAYQRFFEAYIGRHWGVLIQWNGGMEWNGME